MSDLQLDIRNLDAPLRCPICGSQAFGDYRRRKNARCAGCGSMERTRMMAMVIQRLVPSSNGPPVMHFAPEPALARALQDKFGPSYSPADVDLSLYPWVTQPMVRVDLSEPLAYLRRESVQGLVHCHVLEHVPGDLHRIIKEMNEAIIPGGFHTFCVPFFSSYYREDMDPGLSHAERDRLYGQFDHLRSFGTEDFEQRVLSLFDGFQRFPLEQHFTVQDLAEAAIAGGAATRFTSHSVFHFVKKQS